MTGSRRNLFLTAAAAFFLVVFAVMISWLPAEAQTACNQAGNHVIHVAKTAGSGHLTDCDTARISKQNHHTITWQASGNDTLTIQFNKNGNPFQDFWCQNQKQCTTGTIGPNAQTGTTYNYKVTLNSGGNTYTEDPGVIIDP
ncbi:MAG: hypothetical protein PHX83_01970 [Acidobacteriia bacterium]|nr:hypothetical protein [Terriglobia bacterium]